MPLKQRRPYIIIFVTFTALPLAPESVQVSEITATSVKLSWSYKGPDELAYYVIQHKPKHANHAYAEISGITTMYYQVRNLSPYTEYEFFVIAVNDIGRGPPSTPVLVTTGETSQYSWLNWPTCLISLFSALFFYWKKYFVHPASKVSHSIVLNNINSPS
jgi:hypothetical protein